MMLLASIYYNSTITMKQIRNPLLQPNLQSQDQLGISQSHRLLMQLQGECKIKQVTYLKVNYLKGILSLLLAIVTVVGLFLLKYFKKLRTIAFYNELNQQQRLKASHLYIKGDEGDEQISTIQDVQFNGTKRIVFQYKKLKYEVVNNLWVPLGFSYTQQLGSILAQNYIKNGLSSQQVNLRQSFYGRNQHLVQVPNYFQFLFDTMTKPFFLFQYLVSLIYVIDNVTIFALLMIAFGFVTTTINYFLLIKSYNKIKQTAQKKYRVKVLRNGNIIQVNNTDLVPGDLYRPQNQIPCDSIMVRGQLFVDEVSLTGQNVPISKTSIKDRKDCNEKGHWLYEGAVVQTKKQGVLALAVHVGYGSRRGRIIRRILNRTSKQPQFFRKLILFQVEILIVSIIIYLITLPQMLSLDVDSILVVVRIFDFITYSFPAPFPIFFNLAYSFCLIRLSRTNVLGTQPQKTVESSRLQTMCFDKTGTLTLNRMQVAKIYVPQHQQFCQISNLDDNLNIKSLFGSCNSVQLINEVVKGDQIDLRMFEHVYSKIQPASSQKVIRSIRIGQEVVDVLKINQYESQFQSMSVLVRQSLTGRYFVFAKGNPEMIHKRSSRQYTTFQSFIKSLSLGGFRSIAFGYKQISQQEVQQYLALPRQKYLQKISLLGVITFINKLKDDAVQTLRVLRQCKVQAKIITGDNIFLGIQTAFISGMIQKNSFIWVIEGEKYSEKDNKASVLQLFYKQNGRIQQRRFEISSFIFQDKPKLYYAIDNDFIVKCPQTFLSSKIKVFARISPENKALIVRKHKQLISDQMSSRKSFKRFFGQCSMRVGMVGDGANDLIAIKQADVGIGISSSDAVFSASFAVKDLSQILTVLLESKNTQRIIIEMAKYYGIAQFTSLVVTLLMSLDATYFTSFQLLYKNFINNLSITLFLGLCHPAKKLSKWIPNSNLIDLQNHLIFWGTMIIYSLGLIVSDRYYASSDDFSPNPHPYAHFPQGWNGVTKSSTLNFLASNVLYISLPFFIYVGAPWKCKIWQNKALIVLIIVNVIALLIIGFTTAQLEALDLMPIGITQVVVVFVIMLVSAALVGFYNMFVRWIYLGSKMRADLRQARETQMEGIEQSN